MKCLITTVVLAAVIAPAAALGAAPSGDAAKNANASCAALRARMGPSAFTQAYGTFGQCVSRFAQLEQRNVASAQASCEALQADPTFPATHGGKTFAQYYGTGKDRSNAFGKCVSAFAKASSQAEQQGRLNPAQTCRASRTQMGTGTFNRTYGANANDRNAFGKCVSSVARSQSQNELNAAAECRGEQDDATFPATHAGQTFAQAYGTNADDSNAFGKCVSQKASETSNTQQQATVSAAKQCRSEENAGATAFRAKYGTFGRCVSQNSK